MYIYSDTLLGKACDFLRVCEEKLLSRRLKDVVNLPGITWMQITRGHQATFYPPTHPVSDHSLAVVGCSILVGRPSWDTRQPPPALHGPGCGWCEILRGQRPWGDHPEPPPALHGPGCGWCEILFGQATLRRPSWDTTSSTRPDAMTGKTRSNKFSRSEPADKIRVFSRFCWYFWAILSTYLIRVFLPFSYSCTKRLKFSKFVGNWGL